MQAGQFDPDFRCPVDPQEVASQRQHVLRLKLRRSNLGADRGDEVGSGGIERMSAESILVGEKAWEPSVTNDSANHADPILETAESGFRSPGAIRSEPKTDQHERRPHKLAAMLARPIQKLRPSDRC